MNLSLSHTSKRASGFAQWVHPRGSFVCSGRADSDPVPLRNGLRTDLNMRFYPRARLATGSSPQCVNSDLGESEFELLMWAVQGQSVPYTPHIARVTPKLGESKMLYFPRPPRYTRGPRLQTATLGRNGISIAGPLSVHPTCSLRTDPRHRFMTPLTRIAGIQVDVWLGPWFPGLAHSPLVRADVTRLENPLRRNSPS